MFYNLLEFFRSFYKSILQEKTNMYKNINCKFTTDEYKTLKKLRGSLSWQTFFMGLVENQNKKLPLIQDVSLEQIRQEIKSHVKEHIQTPTVKTYDHTNVVDDVREHLLAHMQNKQIEHQGRHDEQDNKINSLAQAIHKITNVMPSLNNNVPNTTMHKIRNKTDILDLVNSCVIKL